MLPSHEMEQVDSAAPVGHTGHILTTKHKHVARKTRLKLHTHTA